MKAEIAALEKAIMNRFTPDPVFPAFRALVVAHEKQVEESRLEEGLMILLDASEEQGRVPSLMVKSIMGLLHHRYAPIGSLWRRQGWGTVLRVENYADGLCSLGLASAQGRVSVIGLVELLQDYESVADERTSEPEE